MLLGKIVGTLVSTRKEESMMGLRFMVVKQVNVEGEEMGDYVIAADVVGAGVGEFVLYARGSSARQTVRTRNRPCDAVIMAIVDTWEVNGVVKYRKTPEEGE
ncbi:MAG: EutN/CcmL family microcompartment protein [Anaerolineae bacterium]